MKELQERNLIYQCTDEKIYELLKKGGVNFYIGIDPTADSMHIGHLLSFIVAKRLELLGNNPVVVLGTATARIGDPSGKKEERKLIDGKIIDANAKKLETQIKKIFGSKFKVFSNIDWLNMDLVTLLRDYGKYFNINTMISKDSVKSRLETGLSFTEFTYQILQGIDFYHLASKEKVILQIGGQDQWGNIVSGIEISRKKGINEELYGITIPLLTKKDGTKFGKTESGAVWLDENLTSPYEMYQYFINIEDAEVEKLLFGFSMLPLTEINKILENHKKEPFKRIGQNQLASELVEFVHGEAKLNDAKAITNALFKNEIKSLSKDQITMMANSIKVSKLNSYDLAPTLVELELAKSNREAREFINGGSIRINDEPFKLENFKSLKPLFDNFFLIKRGKRNYAILYIKEFK